MKLISSLHCTDLVSFIQCVRVELCSSAVDHVMGWMCIVCPYLLLPEFASKKIGVVGSLWCLSTYFFSSYCKDK